MILPVVDSPPPPEKRASQPSDRLEKIARQNGATLIAGVDEVGRGPLAGPVVTAAVVFQSTTYPSGLNDSKRLSARARVALFDEILATASVSIAVASLRRIEEMNILHASLWAMTRAICGLPTLPDHVLVDGNKAPANMPCPCQIVIGGDAVSVSISAASIVAKVTRDRLMENVALVYPQYGFERHMGYGTPSHLAALREHGPCPQHRRGFAPVREQQLGLNF
jgi:ribonuclease HII